MDYQKFQNQYEIIKLSGLKGLDYNCLAQDRNTFKTYDYSEIVQRVFFIYYQGVDIDRKINFLKFMNTLDHPNILKLHNYSYLFVQENHGDPFCKFFLVFEYCESSLVVEMQKLKQLKKILPKQMLLKMTIQLVEALKFLQEHDIKAKIQIKDIYLSENGDFKLMALEYHDCQQTKIDNSLLNLKKQIKSQINKEQSLKKGLRPKNLKFEEDKVKKQMKFFYSPEEFKNMNSVLEQKHIIDKQKSEMFNLGMIILQSGIQEDMQELYKNYFFNQNLLEAKIEIFSQRYGEYFAKIIKLILSEQSQRLQASDTLIMLENEMKKGIQILKLELKENALQPKQPDIIQILPQEYQAELDNKIGSKIKKIEDQYHVIMYANGDRFRGFKDEKGLIQGWAQYWFSKGQKYEGEFKDGKYHGIGGILFKSSVFLADRGKTLRGVQRWGNHRYWSQILQLLYIVEINNEIYFGGWKNNKNHGFGKVGIIQGTYFWANGARYSGEFRNDIIMGKGTLVLPEMDGKSVKHYEGIWQDNGQLGFVMEKNLVTSQIPI